MPHFELPVSIKATAKMDVKEVTSSNIVAKLPGSDPKLKDTYVVLSAHVDHVGIGQPINGDKIYNGAMDNASGTAVLMDVAAELKKSKRETEAVFAVRLRDRRREGPARVAIFCRVSRRSIRRRWSPTSMLICSYPSCH